MTEEVTSSSVGVMSSETGSKLCQICGDISTGFYYSVWSCEGCKAFFKRCLQAKDGANYVCPATNSCTIDKTRRKCCQACRLRKCYEVGMQKTGSRRERSSKTAQKSNNTTTTKRRKRNSCEVNTLSKPASALPPPTCSGSHIVSLTNSSGSPSSQPVTSPPSESASPESFHSDFSNSIPLTPTSPQNSTVKAKIALTSSGAEDTSSLALSKDIKVKIEGVAPTDSQSSTSRVLKRESVDSPTEPFEMPIHPLVKILIEIEPPVRLTNHEPVETETEESLMTSFVKLADTELVDVITWAKNVPGYSSLALNDRIHLVDSCWMEILVCGLIWRSCQIGKEGLLCFAPDLICDRSQYYTAGIGPIGDRMVMVAKQFKDMALSEEEFVCFRSLTLLNADLCCLEDFDALRRERQRIIDALTYTIQHRSKKSETRLINLLLMLPHVRQCGVNSTAHMFEMQHEEAFPIAELVKEMLQAQQPYTAPTKESC